MRDAVLGLLRALWRLLTAGDRPALPAFQEGNTLRQLLAENGRFLIEFDDGPNDRSAPSTLILYENGHEVRRHVGPLSDGCLLAFASPRRRRR